jgi:uncharacterized protein
VQLTRRQVLRSLAGAAVAATLPGCGAPFADTRLRIATGGTAGEYFRLGRALAQVWQEQLRLTTQPTVLPTNGSPANVTLLTTGAAEVAVSQLDVAADRIAGSSSLRALAAVYNDALQIVVPADSPIRAVTDLRGARVSLGPENSGVAYVAQRVLAAADLAGPDDVRPSRLDLGSSVTALRAGEVDAFFWVGALPTTTVTDLAAAVPLRLLDLEPLLDALRARYPVYAPGTVLAGTYRIAEPVATLLVRNVLLVDADLDAGLAHALTAALFADQQRLADATQAARTVDARSAILTQPVPLHDGALRWFSDDAMA